MIKVLHLPAQLKSLFPGYGANDQVRFAKANLGYYEEVAQVETDNLGLAHELSSAWDWQKQVSPYVNIAKESRWTQTGDILVKDGIAYVISCFGFIAL